MPIGMDFFRLYSRQTVGLTQNAVEGLTGPKVTRNWYNSSTSTLEMVTHQRSAANTRPFLPSYDASVA